MRTIRFSFYSVLFVLLLAGCATTAKDDASNGQAVEAVMKEADAARAAGEGDRAMQILKSAANRYPAEKGPWLKMAQFSYEKGSYGEAIIQALEALQRDPKDNVANSIVVVSGLRLSTKSLADLRSQNGLSGSVKNEAQDLAKLLRDNLGESVLVPNGRDGSAQRSATQHRPVARTSVPVKGNGKNSPKSADKPEADSGSSNPFGGLK